MAFDNSKGYLMDNVIECCRPCNVMKQKMSYAEFVAHIHKIYNKLVTLRESIL